MNDLIEDIVNLHKNRIDFLQKISSPKIGWLSIYTPEEIIYAANFVPYRIIGESMPIPSKAGTYLHRNLCPYVLSCFEEGLEGTHNFSDGVLIVNACDARRRLYDAWKHYLKTKFVYMLDFPKVVNSETKDYFKKQIHQLIKSIEEQFNCELTEDSIRKAISLCNETRTLLDKLYSLRQGASPPITGAQAINIVKASMTGLKKDFNERLSTLLLKLDSQRPNSNAYKHRVLLCGSYFDHTNVIDLIEELGAVVVCEDISTGVKYFEGQVDPCDDPVNALANYYLEKATCARMIDSAKRFNHMWNLIESYNVQSVIYFSLKFCDNNLLDFPYQKKRLNKRGIPVLLVEGERAMINIEQIKTRIHAFLESQLARN